MKLLCMSDLHGKLPTSITNNYDVACICGDIMPLEYQRDEIQSISWLVKEFIPWCTTLPVDMVFICWGNHDFIGEKLAVNRNGAHRKGRDQLRKLLCDNPRIRILDDEEFIYKGVRFYGCPWTTGPAGWAFYTDNPVEKYMKIPKNTDVLLTHQAPDVDSFGMVLQPDTFNYMKNYGSPELAEIVKSKNVGIHIFGHIHTGCHQPLTIDNTMFCNVSLLDEDYKPSYAPFVININNLTEH